MAFSKVRRGLAAREAKRHALSVIVEDDDDLEWAEYRPLTDADIGYVLPPSPPLSDTDLERVRIALGTSPVLLGRIPRWFGVAFVKWWNDRYDPADDLTGPEPEKMTGRDVLDLGAALVERVNVALREMTRNWRPDPVLQAAVNKPHGDVFDHWGMTVFRGQSVLVSEPYCPPAIPLLPACGQLAQEMGATFLMTPNSWHRPGSTIRLVWLPGRCDANGNDWNLWDVRQTTTTSRRDDLVAEMQPYLGGEWMGQPR